MEKSGSARLRRQLGVAVVFVSVLWAWTSVAHAQRVRVRAATPTAGASDDDESGPGNFTPPDRNILQLLNRSKKALNEHRYGEALEGLSEILRGSEDYFYQPDRKLSIYRSLKAEALQLLGEMPREGRDLYEVRSGADARDRLNRAIATGNEEALAEISGRYFHTQAGYEATYLLALRHMDHGQPLAAALNLKRLHEAGAPAEAFEPGLSLTQAACYYQAGMTKECQQVLVDLKRRTGKPSAAIAGRHPQADPRFAAVPARPWFEQESDAPAWLAKLSKLERMSAAGETDQWTMFRGDPARNASTVGSAPLLNYRWRVEVTGLQDLEEALQKEQAACRGRGFNVLSGLHPLAVGNLVLMRTTSEVLAVDLENGKRKWPTAEEPDPADTPQNQANGFVMMRGNNMSPPAQYGQRIWDDATYGTISSDGKLLYVIEQLGLGVTGQPNMIMIGPGRNDTSSRAVTNCLAAYEISTEGKRIWALPRPDPLQPPDTFFLGAPLPLKGQLFVIAEVKDQIRLLALNADNGDELWHQQLAMVEGNISQDPVRRLAGVSPSYADGILICPTGSGCVVAVDMASRALLWGYIYPRPGEQQVGGRRFRGMNQVQMAFAQNQNGARGPVPRWLDGAAIIVNGRVLLTPAEADALYCLNLADGKPVWQAQPRGDHYYIACVHQGCIVLVGRNSIDAIKLEDGAKAWDGSITFPEGASVTGHGFYSDNKYYVPLSSGEVATIDLDAGKIVATAKNRLGTIPGNLVCYRDRVISQGLDGVEVYYQTDAARAQSARRLAKNPDDVEGLTLRGEILLNEGKSSEAVADFRRAYAIDHTSEMGTRTRELLRDALLSGLRDDFAAHRSLAGELEKLLDEPATESGRLQRAAYLRYMTIGLHRAHEWRQAVEFCLKLVDLDDSVSRQSGETTARNTKPSLEGVERSYLARRDRWVQARLGLLRTEGGSAAAAEIDRALEPRLKEATTDKSLEKLQRFIAFFDGQPQATAARTELGERLMQDGKLLQAELLLASAADSSGDLECSKSTRKAQAALLADIALLNLRAASHTDDTTLRARRVSDAAACYRQLARQFADVPCHAGLTPSAWLAALSNGDALREEINRSMPTWAKGHVEVGNGARTIPNGFRGPRFDMLFSGPSGPFFTDYTVSFENNQQEISLRDGWGRIQNSPVRLTLNNQFGYYNSNSTLARSCGHLLVVSVGTKICALDPWMALGSREQGAASNGSNGSPVGKPEHVLWIEDLADASGDNDVNAQFNGGVAFANGAQGSFRADPFGPVNARLVCFQRLRNLVAVDPFSGEKLWVRQDIPQGSEVFGDDRHVLVISPGKSEAAVYSATDGEYLGDRKVPRPEQPENGNSSYNNSGYDPFSSNERGGLARSGLMTLGSCVLTWGRGPDGNGRILSLFDPWRQKPVWPDRAFASGSRIDVVEQSAVGVMEPGGHFVLVDLADGHTIADLQLKVRQHFPVSDLLVTRLGDQYIVIVQDRRTLGNENNNEQQMQAPQGALSYPICRSRIYAVDLQGKPAWPEPVDIDHQYFLLSQPPRLPVLVFCGMRYEQSGNQAHLRTSLVAVDRRDGRVVYDRSNLGQMGMMAVDVVGDPTNQTVQIQANMEDVSLKFTDKPLGPAVRRASGAKKGPSALGDALLDAVEHASGTPK